MAIEIKNRSWRASCIIYILKSVSVSGAHNTNNECDPWLTPRFRSPYLGSLLPRNRVNCERKPGGEICTLNLSHLESKPNVCMHMTWSVSLVYAGTTYIFFLHMRELFCVVAMDTTVFVGGCSTLKLHWHEPRARVVVLGIGRVVE